MVTVEGENVLHHVKRELSGGECPGGYVRGDVWIPMCQQGLAHRQVNYNDAAAFHKVVR